MIKTKTRKKTVIDDLPNEILSKILACLSLRNDLDNVQLVSHRWYAVVDETIGREIAISALTSVHNTPYPVCGYMIPPMGNLGFEVIEKMGVKTCFVELTRFSDGEEDQEKTEEYIWEEPPTFKYPHLLRQLYFNGTIRSDLFQSLLQDVHNLTVLELNLLTLSQLKLSDLENLRLANLKGLGIRRCLKHSCRGFNDELGLPNFNILLQNTFPLLTELDLRFPIKAYNDLLTIKSLLQFLRRHCKLKKLYIVMEFPVQVNQSSINQLELDELLEDAKTHPNRGTLNTVEIQGIRLHASYPQLKIWLKFLEKQRSLKSLTVRQGNLPRSCVEQICIKNGQTLESLFLYKLNETEEEFQVVTFDCSVLLHTKRLKTLYALGGDVVVRARDLPKTLVSVFITGSIISVEAAHILLHLPHLKFISLKNAFDQREGCGVMLETLEEFIAARHVKRLILNGVSIAGEFPSDGFPNGDPENPAKLTEFDSWDTYQNFLDWELNSDGYYTNKCY